MRSPESRLYSAFSIVLTGFNDNQPERRMSAEDGAEHNKAIRSVYESAATSFFRTGQGEILRQQMLPPAGTCTAFSRIAQQRSVTPALNLLSLGWAGFRLCGRPYLALHRP
jgi:hypothetical protein